ncbi:purine-cytosine permease family protein [Propionibacteriaceae bacterium Y2011]
MSTTATTESRALRIETHGVDVIDEDQRKGRPRSLFWPWCSANMGVLFVSWGAYILDFGLSLTQALVITVVGVVASFALVGWAALAGQKGSAPTLVLSRAAFGTHGNIVPGIVSYLLLIGWEIFGASMAVFAAGSVAEHLAPGTEQTAQVVALVVVTGTVVTLGILGFEAIMKVQKWFSIATLVMTAGYILLTLHHIDLATAGARPAGPPSAVIGAAVMILAGFGVGWTNCAADYSRYLPRTASRAGIAGWTTFGGSLPVIILVVYGTFLCASNSELIPAVADNPIGPLLNLLPNWFLIPFGLVAVAGMVSGVIIDIYSSGLTLVALGVPIKRWSGCAIDGVIMVLGTIGVVWLAPDFLTPFMGFLITLGVPLAAWSGVFLADLVLRRRRYDEVKLFDPGVAGGYGRVRPVPLLIMVVSSIIGFGLVTNQNASWLSWQGYLLDLGLGGREGPWQYANIGILVSLVLSFVAYLLLCRGTVRRQEATPAPELPKAELIRPGLVD